MPTHSALTGVELHRPVRYTQDTTPASPRAGDQWLTLAGVLKQRDEANTAWITIASGGGGGAFDDLTDVTIASRAVGNQLRPNVANTAWVNVADGFLYAKADYGASGNGGHTTDAAITSGLAVLTAASGPFVAADAGKAISVPGAGAAGVTLTTTILSYTSATSVTLAVNASTTVSAKAAVWGSDDLTPLQNAINAAAAAKMVLVIEPGTYRTSDQLAAVSNLTIWAYGAKGLTDDPDLGLDDAFVPWLGIRNVSNVTVRGLEIDGRQAAWAHSEWKHGIMILNSSDVRIEDCFIHDCKGDGIIFAAEVASTQRNLRGWVQNCRTYNNYRGGLTVTEGQTLKFKGCVSTGHIGTSPMFGMDIEPDQDYAVCKDISIEDCDFSDNGAAGDGAGFYVVMKPNQAVTATSGSSTTLNKSSGTWITNVYIGATLRAVGGNANNIGYERLINANTGTQLTTAAWPNAIANTDTFVIVPNQRDVRLINTRMARNVIHGAILYDVHDFLMDGCQIEYNGNAGLEIKYDAKNIRIVNNTFRFNVNDGIRVGDSNSSGHTQKDIWIKNNWLQGGNLFNAGIETQTGNTIENLYVRDNVIENFLYGVDLNAGTVTNLHLSGNFVRRCTTKSRGLNRNNTIPHDVLTFDFDGGGSEIADATYKERVAPYDLVILGWDFLGTPSGSITADVWSDTYANYPPVDADSIAAADLPTITTAVKAQDLAPTGWTQHVLKGSIIRASVDSATTTTLATLYLFVARLS